MLHEWYNELKVKGMEPMKYKIVFSDIDGTVITDKHEVLLSTAEAVHQLAAGKVPFVLVSARMPQAMRTVSAQMKMNIPLISYGGAYILEADGNVLHDERISAADAKAVIAELKNHWHDKAVVNYYAADEWYAEDKNDPAVLREENIVDVQAKQAQFDALLQKGIMPNKILCMSEPPICEKLEQELKEKFPQLQIVRSSPILLEIMNKSVSKSSGIEVLLSHLGLSHEQAIAFGDNYNDTDMLHLAGIGVAMANAPQAVKDAADAVTDANNDDGIYNYLVKLNLVK